MVVQNVHQVDGHIACDAATESEIVIPLLVEGVLGKSKALGVLDIDCEKGNVWNEEDKHGLERIVKCLTDADGFVEWGEFG